MRRRFKALLGAAVFCGASLGAVVAWPDAPETRASASVLVKVGQGHGSGVHIGGGFVLTAAHVVDGAASVEIVTTDGRKFSPEVLWVSKKYDVALMRVQMDNIRSRDLQCVDPIPGAEVWSRGNPLGFAFITTFGRVAGRVRDLGDWPFALPLDMTIAPGNSGGPLVNKAGEVVGIVVATTRGFPLSIAVPGSAICSLMGRAA